MEFNGSSSCEKDNINASLLFVHFKQGSDQWTTGALYIPKAKCPQSGFKNML